MLGSIGKITHTKYIYTYIEQGVTKQSAQAPCGYGACTRRESLSLRLLSVKYLLSDTPLRLAYPLPALALHHTHRRMHHERGLLQLHACLQFGHQHVWAGLVLL